MIIAPYAFKILPVKSMSMHAWILYSFEIDLTMLISQDMYAKNTGLVHLGKGLTHRFFLVKSELFWLTKVIELVSFTLDNLLRIGILDPCF